MILLSFKKNKPESRLALFFQPKATWLFMKHLIYISILSTVALVNVCNAQIIIPKTAAWKYKADGSNQGTSWTTTAFSDATWQSGTAELGYGDNPVTVLSPSKISYYFRNTISIANPSLYQNFTINLRRDDGIIVYVNGREIIRDNMPAGTVAYTTLSSTNCSDDGNAVLTYIIPSSVFSNGKNVIAAEVHNIDTTSSDITFALEMIANDSAAPVIMRGPYIQSTTSGSTILKWRTNTACNSQVKCGPTTAYGNTTTDAALVTDHQVQINGLTANSKYFYSIGTTSIAIEGNTNNFFWTAPAKGSVQTVRIWATGDFGDGSIAQTTVLNSYLNYLGANKNDIWLWLGDNAYYTGTDGEYQNNVFDRYKTQLRSWNFYPAPGNHEYAESGYQSAAAMGTGFPYFSIFNLPTAAQAGGLSSGTEKYYSYNWGNIHFISLDSYGTLNTLGSAMYTWLQNDLAANSQKWIIAYFHHAPYSKGTHNSDTERELINMRTNIVPLLETYKADLVLSGHSHTYERSYFMHGHYGNENSFVSSMIVQAGDGNTAPYIKDAAHNGTVYAVCGVGGESSPTTSAGFPHNAMINSSATVNGSLALEIKGDTLNYAFLKSDGSITDQFKIIKPTTIRIALPVSIIKTNAFFNTVRPIIISPNSSRGIFLIRTRTAAKTTVDVFTSEGKLMLTDVVYGEKSFDISDFPAGEYIIRCRNKGQLSAGKVILSK